MNDKPLSTNQDCPDCKAQGYTTVWKHGWYCMACSTGGGNVTKREDEKPVTQPVMTESFTQHRGITPKTNKFYGVTTSTDSTGKEVRRVYPYPHATKYRVLPKDFSHNAGFKPTHLFGMDKFNAGTSKSITLVEGEEDTLSAYQMLQGKYPVVGVPGAGLSKELLTQCYDYLNAFEQIVIAFDNDTAGDNAAKKLISLFPGKVYRVSLTKHNDPNDYLVNGDMSDFLFAFHNRKKFTPDNILNTTSDFIKLYEDAPDHQFVPTTISDLDDKIMGLMQGHFMVIKAKTGIGKTEVMRFLEYVLLKAKVPIGSWHLEETKQRSLLGLVSYECKENLTRNDIIKDKGKDKEVREAIAELTKDENLYQFFLRDGEGGDELIAQIRYLAEVCGCKYVFFEPIQDVIAGRTEASKEEMLADLSVRLSKLAPELGIGIITIAHTNDDNDIKYCKMIGQRASVILSLDRDKDNHDEDIRNTTNIYVEKNRPTSLEGYAGSVRFDLGKFMIEEYVP